MCFPLLHPWPGGCCLENALFVLMWAGSGMPNFFHLDVVGLARARCSEFPWDRRRTLFPLAVSLRGL